jgi:hypothetical protein
MYYQTLIKFKTDINIIMKRVIITFALIAVSLLSTKSFAQTAKLNINISDVLSFRVTQPASLDVDFDSEEKYVNGITALATDHVSVVSSRGYVVRAVAGKVSGSSDIDPATVELTSSLGSSNKGNTKGITYGSGVSLPVTDGKDAVIIRAEYTSFSGSTSTNTFDISYLIGAGGAYAGKKTGQNVVPVVYTVTQE